MTRIKKKALADLVDSVEAPYMLEQLCPASVDIEDEHIRVRYNQFKAARPLQESDLFFSFAKLAAHGEPSEAKIKQWVLRFGLPKWGLEWDPGAVTKAGKALKYPHVADMPVRKFREEAQYAHDLLSIYLAIREGDAASIKVRMKTSVPKTSLIHEFREEFKHNRRKWGLRTYRDDSREVRDTMILLAAQVALGEITSRLIADIRPRVGIQRGEGLMPSWECLDLPSAIYLQFYLMVTKHKPIRHCEYCDEPFEATRRDKKVCGPSCRSGLRYRRRKS